MLLAVGNSGVVRYSCSVLDAERASPLYRVRLVIAILPPSVLASELEEPVGLVHPVDLTIADTADVSTKL